LFWEALMIIESLWTPIYQYSLSQDIWTLLDSVLPTPRWKHAAVAICDDRILVTGGRQGETVLADAWIFDTWDLSWTRLNVSLPPIYRHGMAYDGDRNFAWIHVGLDDKFERYERHLWQIRLSSETLAEISLDNSSNPPLRMASHLMEYLSEPDVLIFWGGNCGDDSELHITIFRKTPGVASLRRVDQTDGME
jgi:Galactose oxidase, central domain